MYRVVEEYYLSKRIKVFYGKRFYNRKLGSKVTIGLCHLEFKNFMNFVPTTAAYNSILCLGPAN